MHNDLMSYLNEHLQLSEANQQEVRVAFEKKSFKEGSYLLDYNKVSKDLFFITNGVLRISSLNDKGHEATLFFLKENHFCTILYSFNDDSVSTEAIQAACDTEVLVISKTKLFALYQHIPGFEKCIKEIFQQNLLSKINLRNSYQGLDSTERYRLFLNKQPGLINRVSLGYIASYLDITQQSLSRIRKNRI